MVKQILVACVLVIFIGCNSTKKTATLPMQLTLGKTPNNGGLKSIKYSYWGGSVLKGDDNLYHMFVTKFLNNCGLSSWEYNSVIVHAVSKHPLGPF